MGISISLRQFLDAQGVRYDLVPHERTLHSSQTARVSSIPEDNLAKAVLVKRRDGYLLAIVPASRHVRLDELRSWTLEPVDLATEAEVAQCFKDCELGSVPAMPAAYSLKAVMDNSFDALNDVYFEAGDHGTLVHLTGRDFQQLTADIPHGQFSKRNH